MIDDVVDDAVDQVDDISVDTDVSAESATDSNVDDQSTDQTDPSNPYTTKFSREMRTALKQWEQANPEAAKFAKQARDNHARLFALTQLEPKGIDGVREKYALLDSLAHGEAKGPEALTAMREELAGIQQIDAKVAAGDPTALDSFGPDFNAGLAKLAQAILDRILSSDPEAHESIMLPQHVKFLAGSQFVKDYNDIIDVLNTQGDPRFAVEQQQGEFELLMQSGPLDNPQVAQIQMQVQQAEGNPEAMTPEGQQALQQLQQALQQLPPKISSVSVAQDGSENHEIHAAITLGFMTGAAGRKLKNGDEQQRAIYANIKLHWQEHVAMSEKLTPPKEMEFKGSLSIDLSKFSPEVQSKVFQAAGMQVSPEEATGDASLVPHEVVTEKEGVDEQGIPVKQKIAMVGKGLR